jgi:hypothetical protein
MGDWLRDHLDPKLRQLGSRAIEPEPAIEPGPAIRGAGARGAAAGGS